MVTGKKNEAGWEGRGEKLQNLVDMHTALKNLESEQPLIQTFHPLSFWKLSKGFAQVTCLGSGTPGWVGLQGRFMRRKGLGGALHESAGPRSYLALPQGVSGFPETQTPQSDGILPVPKTL